MPGHPLVGQVNLFLHGFVRLPGGAQNRDEIMNEFLKTTIVGGTALAMLALSSVSASAAICKNHTHTGYGRDKLYSAMAQARADWIAEVTAHDGVAYTAPAYGEADFYFCKDYDASLKLKSCTFVLKPCAPSVDLKKAGKLPSFIKP